MKNQKINQKRTAAIVRTSEVTLGSRYRKLMNSINIKEIDEGVYY